MKPNVISSEIQELITELSYFRSDDLLVNINPKNAILIESDDLMSTPLLEKVLIETRKIEKEFGINPLCKSRGTLQLTLNGKEVSTPLFLIPVKANSNKIEGLVRLQEIEESIIVNPFIIQYLAQNISNFDASKMESETVALKYLQEIKIDGLVSSNTTIDRTILNANNLATSETFGAGGLSGKPLLAKSTEVLSYLHKGLNGRIPIIASGGIFTGADAKQKIDAGASLIQIWTGFIYEGPYIVKNICGHLSANK